MKLWSKFRSIFCKEKLEAEMAEEMRLHVELLAERHRAAGMRDDEARYAAQREFGNVGVVQQTVRAQRGWRWLEELQMDFRFAWRMLGKHPGFTVAAALTLALGIGFVTTLFTMINGVAYGQLPFEDAQRIVNIDFPSAQFDELATRQGSCEALAFVQPTQANLRAGTFVSRYSSAIVSADFLNVLRVKPVLGRGFLPSDAEAGATPTVLIGHDLWQREFDDSASAIGRETKVNGVTHTVIGVMAAGFGFPFNQELWKLRRSGESTDGGMVIGRLRPDVSLREASEQFTALVRSLPSAQVNGFVWDADAKAGDSTPRLQSVEVVPFAERTVKQALRLMLSAILAATFLVLLLACANVANLVLARAIDRKKELAVRAALGASRARLTRQMLTESLLVAIAGAAGGFGIAVWSTSALWAYMMKERPLTGGAPFWMNFEVDGRVFLFVALITILAALVTGLVPALQASRVDVNDALKENAGGSLRVTVLSRVLVNAQMAFSVCLVTVAGLFVTVLLAFNHKTLPYDPASILTARLSLDERRYDAPAARQQFFVELLGRVNSSPGVVAASYTSAESLRLASNLRIEVEGATYANEYDRPVCVLESVSPNFLDGYGVGLIAGRSLRDTDQAAKPPVAVVNTVFAEKLGGGSDVVGRRFRLAGDRENASPWVTIVGITPDLGSVKAGHATRGPVIYRSMAQQNDRAMTLLVRGRGDVSSSAAMIRAEVARLDPELPVARLQTVQEIIELERIGMNSFGTLFVACGLGALLLASVGIYGVVSFGVKLRTREFGVRMALGAERKTIARLVFGQGLRQISIGLAIGAVLAVAAATVLNSLFVGFARSAYDGWVYIGTLAILASVAGVALMIPARRAAKVDPMVALRAE